MAMGRVMASSTTQETTKQLNDAEQEANGEGKNVRQARRSKARGFECAGQDAQGYAELRQTGSQLVVDGEEAQVAGSGDIGVDGGLKQRRGDAGDGDDGEQSHLQAGVEEAARAYGEQAERGKADGVERAALAVEEAARAGRV